ncbi:MAG: hypothetical protein ACXWHB_17460 [Usitatibacter sp.]
MKTNPIRIAFLALASGLASAASAATFSINQINFVDPGTGVVMPWTQLWGNNNNGKVIGSASGDPAGVVGNFPFVYDPAAGTFTRIAVPAGVDPAAFGAISINDSDDIAGTLFDISGTAQGFIISGGVVTYFSHPGWSATSARTMSNRTALHPQGLVVGMAYEPDLLGGGSTSSVGFLYDPVSNTFTDIPGTTTAFTIAQGLNIAGQAVGHVRNAVAPVYSGFLYTPSGADPMAGGTTATFNIGTFRTRARGINDHGIMAMAVTDDPVTGATHTYVGTSLGFQLVDAPSAVGPACADGTVPGTFPEGLNNSSQITGILTDNLGACAVHGFIATPSYVPTGTTPSGAYTFTVDVVPNTPYFLDPAVAIGYDFAIGKKDPRFASVRLPLGIGDNKFVLVVNHKAYDLNAGQLFDFAAHGFKKGVKAFRVACIDPAAMLDPVNSLAFPTEVTFATAGTFTGTQQPLTKIKFKGKDLAKMTQAQCRASMLGDDDAGGPDSE